MFLQRQSLFVAILLLMFGCTQAPPEHSDWSGELSLHGGTPLPFQMNLKSSSVEHAGFFSVGDERIPIPEFRMTADSIILEFSEYGASLRGRWDGTRLSGKYFRYRAETTSIPFFAQPTTYNESEALQRSLPVMSLVGNFRAFIQNSGGFDSSTAGVFWSHEDSVFGTLVAPDGDYGLFAGIQRGDTAYLSRFTGWQVMKLELVRSGTSWSGQLFVRENPPTPFRLDPRPSAEPETPPDKKTVPVDPRAVFRFSGVTPEGDTLTESSPRFKGKALIVDVMGTWCHNCMDAVPVLQQLSKEFGARGVEVIGLSFEISDDPVLAKRNIELFVRRHGVTYPVLFCGSIDAKYADPILKSQLKNFYAYPTTMFIDPAGKVKSVHVGFRGPGTGEAYQREIQTLYQHTEEILKK